MNSQPIKNRPEVLATPEDGTCYPPTEGEQLMNNINAAVQTAEGTSVLRITKNEQERLMVQYIEGRGRDASPRDCVDWAMRRFKTIHVLIELFDRQLVAQSKDSRYTHLLTARDVHEILVCHGKEDSRPMHSLTLANSMREGNDAVHTCLRGLLKIGAVECQNAATFPVWRAIQLGGAE